MYKYSYETFRRSIFVEKLLEQTCSSAYWLGFIFADGWFDFKRYSIGVHVSEKDKEHLTELCSFINSELYKNAWVTSGFKASGSMVRTTKRNTEVFNKLVSEYGIQPKKTYNPPLNLTSKLEQMTDDMFLSFMIGFFDGDGSLVSVPSQNSLTMRFQNHISWEFLLTYFEYRVYKIFTYNKNAILTRAVTTKNGNKTAMLSFARYALINDICSKTKTLNLPVLNRKWKKVDIFLQHRQNKLKANQKTSKRNIWWLDDEIDLLICNHIHMSVAEIQKQFFPNRSYSSICGKLQMLRRIGKV